MNAPIRADLICLTQSTLVQINKFLGCEVQINRFLSKVLTVNEPRSQDKMLYKALTLLNAEFIMLKNYTKKVINTQFGNDDHYCVIEYNLWLKQPVVMKYIP